jgi:translation initiation factor 1
MPDDRSRLVFSSDAGWQIPEPKRQAKPQQRGNVPDDGILRVARERRRGSVVCIVTGLGERECDAVAKALKKLCGSGGTAKNGTVEIQGDHREKIVTYFESQGRKVKKAGG